MTTVLTFPTPLSAARDVLSAIGDGQVDAEWIIYLNQLLLAEKASRDILGDHRTPEAPELMDRLGEGVAEIITYLDVFTLDESAETIAAQDILTAVTSHPDLTEDGATRLFGHYLQMLSKAVTEDGFVQWDQKQNLNWRQLTTMMTMIGHPHIKMPLLGTGWRLLTMLDAPARMNLHLLGNPNTPAPVVARLFNSHHTDIQQLMRTLSPVWLDRVAATHPDLAGLPLSLMLEVFQNQPVPDEWFVDAFQTGVTWDVEAPNVRNGQ